MASSAVVLPKHSNSYEACMSSSVMVRNMPNVMLCRLQGSGNLLGLGVNLYLLSCTLVSHHAVLHAWVC
jgi:hypothetical protein